MGVPFRVRPTLFLPALAVISVLGISGIPIEQRRSDSSNQGLYLLAATPTQNVNYATNKYPTTLYRLSPAKKLDVVREVNSEKDGSWAVQMAGNAIFVLDLPNFTLHIIHTDDPTKRDSVTFNTDRRGSTIDLQGGVTAAIPQGSEPRILLPMIVPQNTSTRPAITLLSISSDASGTGSRIEVDPWNEYAAMRWEGTPGIPILLLPIKVRIEGGNVTFRSLYDPPNTTVIDKALSVALSMGEVGFDLGAINDQYLVLRGPRSGTLVEDRQRGSWKKIAVEGDQSRLRLFGPWLTTDVELETSGPFAGDKPEKSGERDSRTPRLPNVYGEYGSYCFMNHRSFPGTLVLQNLADGRTIRLDTHQEDSEILSVGGDELLYRVNDEIYRAEIVGSELRNTASIVKDDDVPEIHWVFFAQ